VGAKQKSRSTTIKSVIYVLNGVSPIWIISNSDTVV